MKQLTIFKSGSYVSYNPFDLDREFTSFPRRRRHLRPCKIEIRQEKTWKGRHLTHTCGSTTDSATSSLKMSG
ncbi:hypothetical protein QUF70_16990 [Desulfobacterales bacterium HSG17]|nr:hypothetical protein [Desulfobacterales bacterium HSG17]